MKIKYLLPIIRGFFLMTLLLGGTAQAATLVVDRTDDPNPPRTDCDPNVSNDCSLRGAITKANATPGESIITLPAAAQPYTIEIPTTCDNNNADGDFDIIPANSGATVIINGAGASATIIDGGDIDRVFDVRFSPNVGSPRLTLNDLTVQNGTAHDIPESLPCSPDGDGGGIQVEIGSLTMNNAVVRDNVGGFEGGGIANEAGVVTIHHSTISGNHADVQGGGLYNGGCPSLEVTDSTINENDSGFDGGGVFTDCETSTFINATISANTAGQNGGGLMLTGNSTIQLRNATVTDNTAAQDGGGVFIANNSDLFIRNTIIAANHDLTTSDSTDNPDCTIGIGGALTSEGFNLIGSDAGCAFAVQPGDQVGTNVNPIDPRLGPLADNGGPTRTHALLLTPVMSPAIDTANPAGCFSNDTNDGSLLTTDQRGSNRTFDGGPAGPSPARCDIGAFELGGCGDGFSDPAAEECDDGNTADGDGCSSTCLLESCGDGVIQIFEQCDDGNNVNGDGCDSNCHNEPVTEPEGGGICGNGIIESGEICDNGVANGNQPNRACRTDCSAQRCGDDIVDNALGEECDGNREDCNPTTCKIDACAVIAADAQNVVSRADLANFLDKYEVGLDGHSAIPGFEECVILFSAGGRVNVTDIKTRAENSAGCSLGRSERLGTSHLSLAMFLLAPMSLLTLKRTAISRSRKRL